MRPGPTAPAAVIPAEALQAFLERASGALSGDDLALLTRLVASLAELTRLIRAQGTTLARLRRLVGGLSSEKTEKILPPDLKPEPAPEAHRGGGPSGEKPEKPPVKGHGRIPSAAYPDAQRIPVKHASLEVGMCCPECAIGHLYGLDPVELLRVFGQAPLVAKLWLPEHFRCSACTHVFTALAPAEAQGPKFDETAVAMMALLRYGNGQPLNRLDHLQDYLKTPVPASTQWQVVSESAALFAPVYEELLRLAAQSPLLHDDDTYVRILELMGRRRAALFAKGELDDPERTGLFTTGVVARTADERTIALFFSGRKHAGENLAALLKRRAAGLPPPTLMSDALDRNCPKGHAVVAGNCLCHGRRNLVDQITNFPEECRFLIEALRVVFKVDDRCAAEGLSPEERLRVHQTESGPVMEGIKAKANELLEQKQVEPNSDMGKALRYLLEHWEPLTLFLRVAGAPLHNNICERALKMAIRHRNNSLFYKTERGAKVGDLYMTLIETTVLSGENPFEYLTVLQRFAARVAARPADWLPWTFRATLARLEQGDHDQAERPLATPAAEPSPTPSLRPAVTTPPTTAAAEALAHNMKPQSDAAPAPDAPATWEAALRAFDDASPELGLGRTATGVSKPRRSRPRPSRQSRPEPPN